MNIREWFIAILVSIFGFYASEAGFNGCNTGFCPEGWPGPIGQNGATFNPLSLFSGGTSGAWWKFSNQTSLYQNSNLTTPVASDGDPIGGVVDSSPNGNNLTQASAGARPIYKTGIFNGQAIGRFDGANSLMVSNSFLTSSFDQSMTTIVMANKVGTAFRIHTGHNSNFYYSGRDNTIFHTTQNPVGSTNLDISFGVNATQKAFDTFLYDGAHENLFFHSEGTLNTTRSSVTGNLGLNGTMTVGAYSPGTFKWDGDIAEIFIIAKALSYSQIRSVQDYMAAKYFASSANYFSSSSRLKQFNAEGDSLTFGTCASAGNTWPQQTLNQLGAAWNGTNFAQVGDTVATMVGSTETDPINQAYSPILRPTNIVIPFGGTNDLAGTSPDAAALYSNIVAWHGIFRSRGYKTAAVTLLPRTVGDSARTAQFEADRQTVNTNIRTNWASFSDALMDIGNDALIGQAGQQTNTTYYCDLTHLTDAGYGIIAGYANTAINSLN